MPKQIQLELAGVIKQFYDNYVVTGQVKTLTTENIFNQLLDMLSDSVGVPRDTFLNNPKLHNFKLWLQLVTTQFEHFNEEQVEYARDLLIQCKSTCSSHEDALMYISDKMNERFNIDPVTAQFAMTCAINNYDI